MTNPTEAKESSRMSDETKNDDGELVVLAGSVTIKRQVGAGMAYVDVAQGEPVGDIDDETKGRLLRSKQIGRRNGAPYVGSPRPVAGEVEPDEIDTDVIPGGTVEAVLAWVGDDLARARVAKDMELNKGLKARSGLIEKLDAVKKSTETEPPEVPEHYTGGVGGTPAAVGGVATPVDDSAVADKPASDVPVSGSGSARTGRGRN
jgi:hypothetical protein